MTRILFIDDDDMVLQIMSKAASLLGYNPILSSSPRQGLDLARSEKPDLIMVDMWMDEMDGTDFVRELRCLPPVENLPVVLFSAGRSVFDKDEALKAGANDFLQKPVCLDQLFQTIEAYAVK